MAVLRLSSLQWWQRTVFLYKSVLQETQSSVTMETIWYWQWKLTLSETKAVTLRKNWLAREGQLSQTFFHLTHPHGHSVMTWRTVGRQSVGFVTDSLGRWHVTETLIKSKILSKGMWLISQCYCCEETCGSKMHQVFAHLRTGEWLITYVLLELFKIVVWRWTLSELMKGMRLWRAGTSIYFQHLIPRAHKHIQ